MFSLFYIKRSTEVHAWLWSDEHANKIKYQNVPSLPVLHGNPNSLYHCNSLSFCSAVFYFHSGEHQNQTICHLTLTNKILVAEKKIQGLAGPASPAEVLQTKPSGFHLLSPVYTVQILTRVNFCRRKHC